MKQTKLKLLRPADKNSAFNHQSPTTILKHKGLPSYLLGSSAKIEKCRQVNVLAKILYLTPGLFCPAASRACLQVCNAHSSGRMHMPDQVNARDKRAALYIEEQPYFLARLKAELYLLKADAMRAKMKPAVRLNGSSDIPWETRHQELFEHFADIQFYDYTKVFSRMNRYLDQPSCWPKNYHLTFSADASTRTSKTKCTEILKRKGTVAVPFHSELPSTWCGYPVLDGDLHDARFLDPKGHIVGLRAKGLAKKEPYRFSFDGSSSGAN